MTRAGRWLGCVWRALGSTRLAAFLLAALLLATLLASLFPQKPSNPGVQQAWLSAAALRYPGASGLLQTLGLFDIYHSAWYLALLAALLLNALACTLQRLPRLWRSLTHPPKIARPDPFYQGFAHRAEWPVPALEQGVASAQECLRRRHYRVRAESPPPATCAYIFAEQGRWAQLGTIVTHLSALVLVAAVAARPALLWLEPGVILLPGQAYTVERNDPFTVRAGELTIERHPGGQPRDYRVPLTLVLDGTPAVTQTVRLGHPFSHRQVSFHLQGHGPGAQLETPEGTFRLPLGGSQPDELVLSEAGLRLRIAHRPEGDTLFVEILTASGTLLGSGSIPDGQEIEVRGLPITFNLSRYTTWQVSHDPTFLPAVVAALFLLVGIIVSLWTPHRRLWLHIDGDFAQMAGTGAFARGPGSSFEALASEMAIHANATAAASSVAAQSGSSDQDEVNDA